MSTQSLAPRRQGCKHLLAFSLLSGLLITWLALSSTAFAAQLLPDAPSGTQQGLVRAGVSVVRLLVTYEKDDNSGPVYCTGLGAIVASWSVQNSSDQNSWVLTDSSLVNGSQALCADGHPKAALSSIEVYLSTAYNQQTMTFQSIGPVSCQDGRDCHSGPALFALGRTQGQLLPFIDLAQQQNTPNQNMAIQLTTDAGLASTSSASTPSSLPIPSIATPNSSDASTFQVQAEKFLTPSEISPTNTLEAGTPLINNKGQMTSLHLANASGKQTSPDIQSFISKTIPSFQSHSANTVHDGWQHGMDAYNNKDFAKAHTQFQIAANANPHFQAAKSFAVSSLNLENGNQSGQSNSSNTITIAGVSILLWQLVIAIVLLLAVMLLVITLLLGRSRQRSLEVDLEEAARRATIDAPQIAEMERAKAQKIAEQETAQRASTQQSLYEQPIQYSPVLVPTQSGAARLPCPRCGELVPWDANYCSNCRLLLSPSDSGLHLRAQVISQPAVSARSQTDQPTMPPPPPAMPIASIAEQPTVEIAPKRVPEQPVELQKTEPYTRHPVSDARFQLVVGTRSDPGIKRKYKPNEDSLFAAQGLIEETPTTHPYGLFVIADGMGGHANGQDASRLAIQTIIEHILPKLLKNPNDDEYAKLLVAGIQSANLAVHQRNIEQRGDMGTTVTGALVVDNIAYVVNVGDSRTYLYRESDGLKKITNDHSVVASLVEAGIIKPDDIYTHPKRSHIYRSLGEKPNVEVDLFTVPLQEGDKLLLCSDGLWDMVRDPKIEDLIKNPASNPSATSDSLIQAAFEGGGEDNVSVIVIQIGEPAKVTVMPRIQLLAKPDTVQMPQL